MLEMLVGYLIVFFCVVQLKAIDWTKGRMAWAGFTVLY